MSTTEFDPQAIPLITIDENQQIQVNQDAIDFLKKVPKPISVIGVAGKYRTGKSYLLNRVIINNNSGFNIGKTVNSCTKGIWIWGKPIKGTDGNGRIVNVIVLDSEGLAAIDVDANHDSRIFSLVMLLSSCFVFNSMGAIDEQSLENLSLIVNLTKNIHINSQNNEDLDYEDFACYMPSFMWILRDFALELQNSEGKAITSKQYLENALRQQDGFSEQIERKNRIRRVLKAFFSSRDCLTMIRPMVSEENLRNLEQIDPASLKPQFVQQGMHIRSQLINKTQVKKMNNQELSGSMLGGLLKDYVDAINDSGIPNISNAWTNICNSQSQEAVDKSFKEYEEGINQGLETCNWPMNVSTLKQLHQDCKEVALQTFEEEVVGENTERFLQVLQGNIDEFYINLKTQNRVQYQQMFEGFMESTFQKVIQKKIDEEVYQNFFDIEKDFRNIDKFFTEQEPQGPNKEFLMMKFLNAKMLEAFRVYVSQRENLMQAELKKFKNDGSDLELELKKLKNSFKNSKEEQERVIQDLNLQNKNLTEKIALVNESLGRMKLEKNELEIAFNEKEDVTLQEFRELQKQTEQENESIKQKMKKLEDEVFQLQSKHSEDKALLEQKIEFKEHELQKISESGLQFSNEMSSIKGDFESQLRNQTMKYNEEKSQREGVIGQLQEQLGDIQEEREKQEKRQVAYEEEVSNLKSQLKQNVDKHHTELQNMKVKLEETKANLKNSAAVQEIQSQMESISQKLEKVSEDKQELQKKLNNYQKDAEKEKAIINQTNDFLKSKCEDLKRQLKEQKEICEQTIQSFEMTVSQDNNDLNQQIQSLKDSHRQELSTLEKQQLTVRKNYQDEINRLNELKQNLDDEILDKNQKYETEIVELRENYEKADSERLELKKEIEMLQEQKDELMTRFEENSKSRIQELEFELEEIKQKHKLQNENKKEQQEKAYTQLKEFFSKEIEELKTRSKTDKESTNKKFNKKMDDYDHQIEEMNNDFEEERDALERQIDQMQQKFQFDHSDLIQQQKIQQTNYTNLQEQLDKRNDEYQNLKVQYEENVKEVQKKLDQQKVELHERYVNLQNDISIKEKQIWTLTENLQKKTEALDKVEEQFEKRLQNKTKEFREYKIKAGELASKLEANQKISMQQHDEFQRDIALKNQKIEFTAKNYNDLNKQFREYQAKQEVMMKDLKDDHHQEVNDQKTKQSAEMEELRDRYIAKKKNLKDIESQFAESIQQLESSKYKLQEKAEQQIKKLEIENSNINQQRENLQVQLTDITEKYNNAKNNSNTSYEEQRARIHELERQNTEIEATLSKEQALWDGKFRFQQEEKENLQTELQESKRNFQMMIQKLNSVRQNDQQHTSNSNTVMITKMEQKHNQTVNELKEKHKMTLNVLEDKSLKLEREITNLNNKLQQSNTGVLQKANDFERKLNVSIQNEKSLLNRISSLKLKKDEDILKIKKQTDSQILKYKSQVKELNDILAEQENQKLLTKHQYEQKNTILLMSKEKLLQEYNDLQQQLSSMNRDHKRQIKINERQKHEIRKFRNMNLRNNFSNLYNGNNFLDESITQNKSFLNFGQNNFPSINLKQEDAKSFMKEDKSTDQDLSKNEKILN